MKKFIFMIAALMTLLVSNVNAQYEGNELTDNWAVGVNAGVHTPLKNHGMFGDMSPTFALTLTKYFNPVFGFGVEGQTYVNARDQYHSCTFPYTTNISGLGYVNLTNLVFGYVDKPRFLELQAFYGLGWGHVWKKGSDNDANYLTSKAGAQINLNIGKNRIWGIAVRPAVVWDLDGLHDGVVVPANRGSFANKDGGTRYNLNHAAFEITAGVFYNFKNSNGKHYMTKAKLYDQAEVDRLNAEINALKARGPEVIVKKEIQYVDRPVNVSTKYVVYFTKGSSEVTEAAKETLKVIPAGATVNVLGAADEVSSVPFNQKLSEQRANAVAKYLTDQGYKVDTVTATGETGEIVARVVVVTTK